MVLVTLDAVGSDTLAALPHLRRRARAGDLFESFYSASPETAPAVASMLTGLYPWEQGLGEGGASVTPGATTIAEALAARGLATAAVVGSPSLGRRAGFAQGFDDFWAGAADATAVTKRALRFLGRASEGALASHPKGQLLWLHYADLEAEPGPSRPRYRREAGRLDRELERLLSRLEGDSGRFETHVVVAVDHGTSFDGGDGGDSDGRRFVQERLRVPLLLLPPRGGPRVRGDVASSPDVARTVLWLAGLRYPAPPFARGRNLSAWAPAPSIDPQATAALRVGAMGVLPEPPGARFFAVDRAGRVFTGDSSGLLGRPPGSTPGDDDAARALFRALASRQPLRRPTDSARL